MKSYVKEMEYHKKNLLIDSKKFTIPIILKKVEVFFSISHELKKLTYLTLKILEDISSMER